MQNYTWRFSTKWSLSSNGINWHLKGQRVTFRGVPRAAQRQCSKFRQRQGQIHATEWHIHVKWKTMLFDEIFSVFMVPILFLARSIQTMRWTCIMVQSDSPQRLNVTFFSSFFLNSLCTGILLEVLHCSTIFDQQMCERCDRVASNPRSHLINLNFFQSNKHEQQNMQDEEALL